MILQLGLYLVICWLSSAFSYNSDVTQRPIPLVLALFWINFVVHLLALRLAVTSVNERSVLRVIVLGALAFRGVMVFSEPIQEIDIYRYCWDGAVLRNGVSPFDYSPRRANTSKLGEAGISTQLTRLIKLRQREPGLAQALGRVHFAELTTIYPPISQLVFAVADLLTPPQATLKTRVVTMKFVIVAFDMAVLAILSKLLLLTGRHQGWLISYAWCPLVLKEFAGSGHLDAIAVCFCCLALLVFVQGIAGVQPVSRRCLLATSGLLALAVGAKLYPIALLPVLAIYTWGQHGWRWSITLCVVALGLSLLVLSPMLLAVLTPPGDQLPQMAAPTIFENPAERTLTAQTLTAQTLTAQTLTAQALTDQTARALSENAVEQSGLATFLSRWEMNDLLFMVVEENLRLSPTSSSGLSERYAEPWFVFVPQAVRAAAIKPFADCLGTTPARASFLMARIITLGLFALCVIWFSYRASVAGNAPALLEYSFLTLAWFWLLAPTQNPWYWTWALPLVAFARSKVWLAVSGLSLIYYLRFWCMYQFPDQDIWLEGYPGTRFFDYVIVWVEFGPFLLVLCVNHLLHACKTRATIPR